ncbi:MAG: hypothetical protein SVM79_05205 [Chloroflexota bacterium]|nr:hypothetical protein [Chloroflexota bacterium]
MTVNRSERLATIHNQLIKISQDWALRRRFDPSRARELRAEAILENHAHYLGNIPAYRKLALEEGIDKLTGIDLIKRHLMLSDDIFKSYSQQWLNDSDFARMNEWLSEIHHKRINTDSTGIESIDQWIEHLDKSGFKIVYSSGTSGTFSFVPRDEMNWQLLKTVNTCCLAPLLMHDKMGAFWHRSLIKIASKLLSPNLFEIAINKMGAPDFDGVFLVRCHSRTYGTNGAVYPSNKVKLN